MPQPSPARQRLLSLIRRPDPQVALGEAALAIAWEDQGGADPLPALAHLEAYAAAVAPRLRDLADGPARMRALSAYLFEEQGFHGDPRCYSHPDPANSYLDRVIERRTGLPILLALIYLEVGWRLGLPVQGLALPGHFIVRLRDPAGDQFLDPFRRGAPWSLADCQRQIASFYGEISPELAAIIMAPPGRGAILSRILRNLKQTHLARGDVALALAAVERLLLLDSSDPGELRDRGLLRMQLGHVGAALEDLERYARRHPAATDLAEIRSLARSVVERVAPQN
jgi:regulator of sirC expression with transglutaminase-like and TPR domain